MSSREHKRVQQERLRQRLADRREMQQGGGPSASSGPAGADSGGSGSSFRGWGGDVPPHGVARAAWDVSPLTFALQAMEANERDLELMMERSLMERRKKTGLNRRVTRPFG